MDAITTTARQRAVAATIADLIVAAAAGRALRVAVGCTRPDETAFADQLTEALHACGRPAHCLTARSRPVTTAGYAPAHGDADGSTVAVITSRTPDADETDVCRINIQLWAPNRVIPPAASANRGADGQQRGSVVGQEPDLIVDYLNPGGAAIRHLGPALAARPSSAGSQPDRRVHAP
jgi:hypothetical protein